MYAPHFAAALAIKSRVPRAPTWALLTGAFVPDLLWIALARFGIEPAQPSNFFDDWSHSLLSVAILATLLASAFLRKGKPVFVAIWLAVFSHFLLDFPVHPKRLALAPLTRVYLGWDLLVWGSRPGWLGAINDWWLQLAVLLALLLVYATGAHTSDLQPSAVAASIVLLIGIQLLTLFPCIGY
jgi:hypothetical protein